MKHCLAAGLAAALLAACGGSARETPPPPTVDITGSWTGVVTLPSYSFRLWLRANQAADGADVEATYLTDSLGTGNVTGTVEGDVFRFRALVTNPGCPGEMIGTGRVDAAAIPPAMAVAYSGSTACGGPEAGEALLEREGPPR